MHTMSVLNSITENYDALTKTQAKIAEYIRLNAAEVIRMNISELAAATSNKSESTIVRFYRRLGFSSYHDFIVTLATEIAGNSLYHSYSEIAAGDSLASVKEKLFKGISKTLSDNYTLLDDAALETSVGLILAAKRLFFVGYGQSGYICQSAQFKFMRLGFDCFFSMDSHFNSIQLSQLRDGDLVVAISNSGISKDVVLPIKEFKNRAKVIAITGSAKSELGKIADVCLTTQTEERNYRTDVIMARYVQNMIIDILCMATAVRMGDDVIGRLDMSKIALSYLKY